MSSPSDADTRPPSSARPARLPWSVVVAYGFGGLVPVALFNIAGQLIGLIGNIGLGLSAFWLGVILVIPRLWDAVADPLVGHFSDNLRTRWGRRRPFLLVGGIAVAVTFVVMWWVPKEAGATEEARHWIQLGYILFWLLLFYSANALFEIPHGALGMEMTSDTDERTRLFSAKSFFGNLFAMGTPWLFALASLEMFKGPGGNEMDGMRYVSMLVSAILIPMSVWWFVACPEPAAVAAQERPKTRFWADMRAACSSRAFLVLVGVVFILAMGFNFVGLLNYYISIFYLYGGDKQAAGALLGINGTVWAITGLLAVFPLNWLSRRLGKKHTLGIAILLMIVAQLAKIVCYNPAHPYLVVIPTVLLSAGMLMFFTLGSSMLGDVVDDAERRTGLRNEGSTYAAYWWFIKMGTAFASFVTGALIVFTHFDEKQTTGMDKIAGHLNQAVIAVKDGRQPEASEVPALLEKLRNARQEASALAAHFASEAAASSSRRDHCLALAATLETLTAKLDALTLTAQPGALPSEAALRALINDLRPLSRQAPEVLWRMRLTEIGLPALLSLVSLVLLRFYRLDEKSGRQR
ncbi:MAG TPA: MFS transporter [Candidatus Saccharimonadia bacterium]|nr:MFS transporter [Candidatus Saccharimonadia bacterium]